MYQLQSKITTETKDLVASLTTTTRLARIWFEARTTEISRKQFEARGGLSDSGSGSVYAYFSADKRALYVGQTGRYVKSRLHDQTSPHKLKDWWPRWKTMRFMKLPDDADRLILESLLIAGYEPTENKTPRAKPIGTVFSSQLTRDAP